MPKNKKTLAERVAALEARMPNDFIQSVKKLKIEKDEMLVITTTERVSDQKQEQITQQLSRELGRSLAVFFLSEGTTVGVMRKGETL